MKLELFRVVTRQTGAGLGVGVGGDQTCDLQ